MQTKWKKMTLLANTPLPYDISGDGWATPAQRDINITKTFRAIPFKKGQTWPRDLYWLYVSEEPEFNEWGEVCP